MLQSRIITLFCSLAIAGFAHAAVPKCSEGAPKNNCIDTVSGEFGTYEGEFQRDAANGKGTLTMKTGEKLVGVFKDGKPTEDVQVTLAGGERMVSFSDMVVANKLDAKSYYPAQEMQAGKSGETVVRILVDKNGNVTKAEIMKSSGEPGFDTAAERLANDLKFKPYKDAKGKAIPVATVMNFDFTANK